MKRLHLAIQGRSRFAGLPARSTLVRWVTAALAGDAEVTLRFVGAREGRKLNQVYRRKDYATNVLTFGYARAPVICTDIVLCVPVIRREARQLGRDFRNHLAHLVVHGALHAQGLDHGSAAAARKMEAREIEILSGLGFADPYQR